MPGLKNIAPNAIPRLVAIIVGLLAVGALFLTSALAAKNLKKKGDTLKKIVPIGQVYHAIGNVWCNLSNYGWMGDDNMATPSMEWPGGSGNMHLYQGSIWVAGVDGSGSIHATAGDEYEFYPQLSTVRIDSFSAINGFPFTTDDYVIVVASSELTDNLNPESSTWYDSDLYGQPGIDDDGDGAVDEDPLDYIDNDGDGLINEDFAVVSEEDTYTIYNDLWGTQHQTGDSPLGIEIIERTYAWGDYYNENFFVLDYEVINVGTSSNEDSDDQSIITPDISGDITDLYIGIRFDGDISKAASGEFWYDDLVEYDPELNISYIYDADDPDTPEDDTGEFGLSPGYIYASLLDSPLDNAGRTGIPASHNWWTIDDDPSSDALKHQYMANVVYAAVPAAPYDYRFLQSAGPYDLSAGDTLRFLWATGVGNQKAGMVTDVGTAHWMHANNFDLTTAYQPSPPRNLNLLNWDENSAVLIWDAESAGHLTGHNIYRASSAEGPFSQINTGLVTENIYEDTGLSPGQTYFYAVTNVDVAGGESEHSTPVQVNAGAPMPPAGLRVSIANDNISLAWDPHSDPNVAGFNIYRSGADILDLVKINPSLVTANNYVDATAVVNESYLYSISAVNQSGYESLLTGLVQIKLLIGRIGQGVLLVDDDDETPDGEIDHAMHQMFNHFSLEDWDVATSGVPTATDLADYSTVIWYTDDGAASFRVFSYPAEDSRYLENPIPAFLDSGGHLWLMGGEILYMMANADTGDIFAPGKFARDYLHLLGGSDAGSEFTGLNSLGVTGFEAIGITGLATGTGWPDSLSPDQSATPIYDLQGLEYDPGLTAGVFYDGLDYQVVFFAVHASFIATNGNPLTLAPQDMATVAEHVLGVEFGESYIEDPLPLAPKDLRAPDWGEDYIDLIWSTSDEEDILGNNLYRASLETGPFERVNAEPLRDQHTYRDSILTPAQEYWHYVTTVDIAFQESLPSQVISEIAGRPKAPEKPLLVSQSGISVSLRWSTHPESDVIGYNIYAREFGLEEFSQVNTGPIQDTTATIDLVAGAYYLIITAVDNSNLESYYSPEILAITGGTFDQGTLMINDMSWVPGDYQSREDIDAKIDSGFMNNQPHTDWYVPTQGTSVYSPTYISQFTSVILFTDGGYASALYGDLLAAYALAGGNLMITGYNLAAFGSSILVPFGIYPAVFGPSTDSGMEGVASTGYGHLSIDLAAGVGSHSFERVYPDQENTVSLFTLREDGRSCAVRAELPGGNVVIIIGQSLPFMDQQSADTREFGRIVLELEFTYHDPYAVEDNSTVPRSFKLHQNYPNPFNPVAQINYDLPARSHVSLVIYDLLGRKVVELVNKDMGPGYHGVVWNANDSNGRALPSGVYFARLLVPPKAGLTVGYAKSIKMLLLK